MKTELSFESGAHFEREGLAKPGQRGLKKPGQGREGQKGQTGELGGNTPTGFWRPEGFTPPLRMGP